MAAREQNILKRSGSPRLRQFIEEFIGGFKRKGEAAKSLEISQTELSFFSSGARTPSPEKILKLINVSQEKNPTEDFSGSLDQRLIESGYSPVFFKYLVSMEHGMLVLKRDGLGYTIASRPPTEEAVAMFSDLRFAARHAAMQIAELDEQGLYLLVQPVCDDTDLADGDLAMISRNGVIHFGHLLREENAISFALVDPAGEEVQNVIGGADVHLLARIPFQCKSPGLRREKHTEHKAPAMIRSLDKLRVGISPFQDSLLVTVGTELGLFEEEGLQVVAEPVEWYGWGSDFFRAEHGNDPAIVFSNIFSFVNAFKDLPSLRFLYGVNLFDNGFGLMAKTGSARGTASTEAERDPILRVFEDQDMDARLKIGTIAESDWGAQLFSLCQERNFNLGVSNGYFEHHVFPEVGPLPDRPSIIIADSDRKQGVINDPDAIDKTYSYYLGSIPQRFRLEHDFGWQLRNELEIKKPFPVNGFVGMPEMLGNHMDVLLRFLRVWFRIVNYIQPELQGLVPPEAPDAQTGSRIVQRAFESGMFSAHTAKLKITATQSGYSNEIVSAWRCEKFPRTPSDVEEFILGSTESSPWKADACRAIHYLAALFHKNEPAHSKRLHTLEQQINSSGSGSPADAFALQFVHQQYVARYGLGTTKRTDLREQPLPDLLYATSLAPRVS